MIQPTFLTDYPVALSPLAKRKPDDPTHAERFQPYIGGGEIGNAFTELNDPLDQLARFVDQQADREAGDEEAMPIDDGLHQRAACSACPRPVALASASTAW